MIGVGYQSVLHSPETVELPTGTLQLRQLRRGSLPYAYKVSAEAHETFHASFATPLRLWQVLRDWVQPTERLMSLCSGVTAHSYQIRVRWNEGWLDVHMHTNSKRRWTQSRVRCLYR